MASHPPAAAVRKQPPRWINPARQSPQRPGLRCSAPRLAPSWPCSGLFNIMRNLGGAVGIALLQTLLTKREQYHSNVLMQSVSLLEQATPTRIEQLTQYFMNHGVADRAEATHRALVAIGKIVQKQAYILAFSDTFFLLGVALIVALMAALLLKKPDHLASGGGH